VTAIDVRSHTNWVRRALQLGELMTAFEIPSDTQGTFTPEVITQVCTSLPTLNPVGVLRLLLSILVPLKGRGFTGGELSVGEVSFQAEGGHVRDCQDQSKPDVALDHRTHPGP
jgi:hypothetical protein